MFYERASPARHMGYGARMPDNPYIDTAGSLVVASQPNQHGAPHQKKNLGPALGADQPSPPTRHKLGCTEEGCSGTQESACEGAPQGSWDCGAWRCSQPPTGMCLGGSEKCCGCLDDDDGDGRRSRKKRKRGR
jgi:hypothetical protein